MTRAEQCNTSACTDSRTGICYCKAKHGVFFDDYELLDIESNHEEALNILICPQHRSSLVCLVVSTEPYLNILDNLSSCVHLEKITPTLTDIFVGSLAYEELLWRRFHMFYVQNYYEMLKTLHMLPNINHILQIHAVEK